MAAGVLPPGAHVPMGICPTGALLFFWPRSCAWFTSPLYPLATDLGLLLARDFLGVVLHGIIVCAGRRARRVLGLINKIEFFS